MSLTNLVRQILSQKKSAAAARSWHFQRRIRPFNFEHLESRWLLTVSWSVAFNDPSATYSAYYAPIRNTLLAAANDWGSYFPTSNASIELGVDFTTSPSTPRTGGSSETTAYLGKNGALDVWEQSISHEIRTGSDPNGATRDGHVIFNADHLANELWFDPTPTNRGDDAVPLNRTDAYSVMLHELGHALGFNGWRDYTTGALPGNYESSFDQLVTIDGSGTPFFNGTAAMAAYGSRQVPLTYSNIMHFGNGVGTGRPGSDLIGDLMNGVVFNRGQRYSISPLDLAVLRDLGLPILVGTSNTADFGDAPDTGAGTGTGNYQTLLADNGPRHDITSTQSTLFLGARVDAEANATQSSRANGDDITTLPDDEDGLVEPAQDLLLTVGTAPTVRVRATNTTGAAATLYGWIDVNRDGAFDNATERASVAVPTATAKGTFTLTFPTILLNAPAGATYARFRLSSDAAAANSTGAATGGELEDYAATITKRSDGTADSTKSKKIASDTNGGPTLAFGSFGSSVAALGDLDGDGVTDLAVGADFDSTEGFTRGAVHVLFMNADGTVKSSVKIASGINGGPTLPNASFFGNSVASLGDLDGDGVTDLAVGARYDGGTGGRGAVYVLLLKTDGTVKSSVKIASGINGGPTLANGDRFGKSVASLSDLDGDGVTDLAVGAYEDDTGGTGRGAVYVLLLNSSGTVKSSVKIADGLNGSPTLANNNRFGSSVASLGDLDGDGVTDLAVGGNGTLHVLLLNTIGTVKSSVKIASGVVGGFGNSAASLGDLDGDGVADLAVGASGDDTGGGFRGAVHVLLLNGNGTVKSAVKIASGTNGGPTLADGDNFGKSVASLGDFDGDGVTELAVGVFGDDTGGTDRGAVHVLFLKELSTDFGDAPDTGPGTATGNYQTLLTDNGPRHDTATTLSTLYLGARVDAEADAAQSSRSNGDDIATLPDDEDGLIEPAQDLVLTVGSIPTVRLRATNTTGTAATLYGWIDYNRDGVFDNASERASAAIPTATTTGTFTLTFSKIPTSTAAGATYARFRLSSDVAAANSTGAATGGEVEDYPATITRRSDGTVDSAKTKKIASATPNLPTLADGDNFGRSVASLGDLDGDGVTDLAVGAPGDDTNGTNGAYSNCGAVYVQFMNANGTVKGSVKIASGTSGGPTLADRDLFGQSVASLGDLDGDGVTDLAVGAYRDDTGGTDRGAAYVLLMNASGTVKSSVKIASGTNGGPTLGDGDLFGSSVASLGDLDGDGVTDLAIGAVLDDTNGTIAETSDRGAVFVLLMNANGTVKSSVKIASGTNGGPVLADRDNFGSSVASLGDLDGDSVTDLAVGALFDDTGGTNGVNSNRGAVYVQFMNANGTVKSSLKIASGANGGPPLADNDVFGRSVASLGDLDGDGVTDLAVGAINDDTGGTGRGAVHVLLMKSDGTVKSSVKIASGTNGGPSLADNDVFGRSVASLGDLDGDGVTDLAVGAQGDDTGGSLRGAVHVLFLKALNAAPVLDATKSPVLAAVNEDAGPPSGTVGTLVSSLVDFAAPSGQLDNVSDVDSGALLGIAITATDTTNGTFHYFRTGDIEWSLVPAVSEDSSLLLAADAGTRLYFQPAANFSGTVNAGITFRAWDQTSGTSGTLASTAVNGGTTAYSTVIDTASIAVNPVNDLPSFSVGGPVTVSEDPGPYSAAQASSIADGDPEVVQTLTFNVSNDNNGLFSVQPAIALDGKLSFTPAANANGSATVTVSLTDDATAGGAALITAVQTFNITIDKPPLRWHNTLRGLDVTGTVVGSNPPITPDNLVVAGDALAIINYINAFGAGPVPTSNYPTGFGEFGPPYLDTANGAGQPVGDNFIAAGDVLAVINWINAFGSGTAGPNGEAQGGFSGGGGEGEGAGVSFASDSYFQDLGVGGEPDGKSSPKESLIDRFFLELGSQPPSHARGSAGLNDQIAILVNDGSDRAKLRRRMFAT